MSINYELIPEHCRHGMQNYIEHGIPVGDFLTAVLENDFMEAVTRCDATNRAALREYAIFLHQEAPREAHGSPEAVKAWIKKGGLHGKET